MPPPRPVTTLVTINVSRFGANAETNTPDARSDNPASATGRRPNESDKGPTETTDTAQAANVTVATCPAIETDTSNSAAMSTNNGASIRDELWVEKKAMATAAKNRFWFILMGAAGSCPTRQTPHRAPAGPDPSPTQRPSQPLHRISLSPTNLPKGTVDVEINSKGVLVALRFFIGSPSALEPASLVHHVLQRFAFVE